MVYRCTTRFVLIIEMMVVAEEHVEAVHRRQELIKELLPEVG
jgi:hypothetical protein